MFRTFPKAIGEKHIFGRYPSEQLQVVTTWKTSYVILAFFENGKEVFCLLFPKSKFDDSFDHKKELNQPMAKLKAVAFQPYL